MLTVVLVVVGALLLALTADFIARFIWPSWKLRNQLNKAVAGVDRCGLEARSRGGHVSDLGAVGAVFDDSESLAHVWDEFRHTLHEEKSTTEFDELGQPIVDRYRQTVPAELFFSTRALVEVPLKSDYFRHLPGMLTGLGIIGTFFGLITGLGDFRLSDDVSDMQDSVQGLLSSVREAFVVSAIAIVAAIAITWFERRAFTNRQRQVHDLQQAIDRIFDAGANEEYLASIARGSEESASALVQIRQTFVNDLRAVMEDVSKQQVAGMSEAIASSLQSPLEELSKLVDRSLEDQQTAVHKLLDETLEAFAARLDELVGERLTGAAQAIQDAADNLRAAMVEAPAQIEIVARRVAEILGQIAGHAEQFAQSSDRIVSASDQMTKTVESSAETLDYAIGRFQKFGEEVGQAMDSGKELSESLGKGATEALSAATALELSAGQIGTARGELAAVAATLAETAEQVGRDGESQRELAEAVERSAASLTAAQADVERFLSGVDDALTSAHQAFAREMHSTLNTSNESFHQSLSNATTQLAGVVSDMKDFIDSDFRESVDNLQVEFARLGQSAG